MLSMTLMMLISLASVSGAGIPNPDTITSISFGAPETVDPGWAYDTASAGTIQNIFEPLFMYDKMSIADFVPLLADTWPGFGVNPGNWISPSPPDPTAPAGTNQTWYYHIRANVPWQDSKYGTLKPSDVEYSLEREMLMDHSGGPAILIYMPLLSAGSSTDWDANEDGTLDATEYAKLDQDIDGSIGSNATHVWFNLPKPFPGLMQILTQSWGMIMCQQWAAEHGCWNGQHGNFAEFQRQYDPPSPGPLMTGAPAAMGTGPYKLAAMNTDPHTGFELFEKFDNYWRGWPAPGAAGFAKYALQKNVEEWANRKAQFLSTDPGLQADYAEVPRANVPEMHIGGNKDGAAYPGFRYVVYPSVSIGNLFFNYYITQPSDYTPKLGTENKPDLFSDRDLRLAFMYCFNATQFMAQYFLGEGVQPKTCEDIGGAYYNDSKIVRNIDLAKATAHFQAAWGGQVWSKGITLKLTYNTGNRARQTEAEMFTDIILHRISWPSSAKVDIAPLGVPWSNYIPDMTSGKLCAFFIGWQADYPDPDDWYRPYMDPDAGDYAEVAQNVVYGLGNINAEWMAGASYGPPPYTNALGEKVTAINNTYVRHILDVAVASLSAMREKLYNELMDIYYAEGLSLPTYQALNRHYERTWLNGWVGEYNNNPYIPAPAWYWYTMYKAAAGTVHNVDLSAVGSITNITTVYPYVEVYNGEMRVTGKPARINYTLHVKYVTGTVDIFVEIALLRNSTTGTYYFPIILTKSMGPGEDYSVDVSWYESSTTTVGNWTISLYVTPMGTAAGEVTDTDLTNNKIDHPLIVKTRIWPVDLDGSGDIKILDISVCGKAYGSVPGQPRWDARADINGDGKITIIDMAKIAKQFGKTFLQVAATL